MSDPEGESIEKYIKPPGEPKPETELSEPDLSPEVIQKIMAKVQDIDTPGTGYSRIFLRDERIEKIQNIFQQGLLGRKWYEGGDRETTKQNWAKSVHGERKGIVHAHITDRISLQSYDPDRYNNPTVIGRTFHSGQPGAVTLLFDVSKFREIERPKNHDYHKYQVNTFYAQEASREPNKDGKTRASEEYGFHSKKLNMKSRARDGWVDSATASLPKNRRPASKKTPKKL